MSATFEFFVLATISFASDSDASESRTESSSKDDDSTEQSDDDSKSEIISSIEDIDDANKKERRSKSPKNHKDEEEDTAINNEQTDVVDVDDVDGKQIKKKTNSKNKGKKNKQENEQEDKTDAQSEKSEKKVKEKSKNKGKKRKIDEEGKTEEEVKDKDEANNTRKKIVVVESSTGTETSITKLLTTSFKISDRVLLVTEWGDFFLAHDGDKYFLFDGCLCDYNALIQTNLTELDSSTRLDNVDDVVKKILLLKGRKNTTMKTSDSNDVAQTTFSGDVDSSFWELIEGMIELMKTTAKFDQIKNDLL